MQSTGPRIVVIGGGTGSFSLLSALKHRSANITALVNMADDGGSTGTLRHELGVLPPGDVRQCLVALSGASHEIRELFNYRFPSGSLQGHPFGNLFLSAAERMTNNFNDAIRMAGELLKIQGRVLPVTLDRCELICNLGKLKITGQYNIELADFPIGLRPELTFIRPPKLSLEAATAIQSADLVVVAPGNLYASLAPALLVDGLRQAIKVTQAPVVYVCNLVNKPNHTPNFAVHDYAREIERFIGAGSLDFVLYNTDKPSKVLLKRYALEQEYPVTIDMSEIEKDKYIGIGGKFLSHSRQKGNPFDNLIKRSLIRHDGQAIASALLAIINT